MATARTRTPKRATPARRPAPRAARPKRPVREQFTILPLTPDRWRDFAALFGPRGACAGCWCTWARLTHAEFRLATPERRRAHFRRVVGAGDPPGLLAYDGERAVGWVALAPRATYRRYATSRVLAPVDDTPVWSVPCFFIAPTHRRRGLSVALLQAACAFAASRGARVVEGYPVDTHGKRQAAAFVWTGLPSVFEAAGFREVARRSEARPIMRRVLRAPRGAARG
jgi:GNAT superfamily N-acetyltransferase